MNFRVIFNATYKVYDLTNKGQVQAVDFTFTKEQNESHFKTLASSLSGKLPPELALLSYVDYDVSHGGTVVLLNISYPGPAETLTLLVKPFTDLKTGLYANSARRAMGNLPRPTRLQRRPQRYGAYQIFALNVTGKQNQKLRSTSPIP